MIMYLFFILSILISVMFLSLLERKFMASAQLRLGPYRILQALLDGLKLFLKGVMILPSFTSILYILSSFSFLFWGLFIWITLFNISESMFLFIFVLFLQAISIYSPLIASISSNSKYAVLASTRMIAQMISYEVTLSVVVFSISIMLKGMNWPSMFFLFVLYPMMVIWVISCLAELNRTPFDLIESESELVSGFNVEYSSVPFALLFLSEYSNILFFSLLTGYFFTKFGVLVFFFVFVFSRCVFPRLRYDKLMMFCWKKLLPVSLVYLVFLMLVN